MASHRFVIGELVRLKGSMGLPPSAAELFRVTATMPPVDRSLQYRIRNDEERHERVAREDNLEAVAATAPVAAGV